MFIIERRELPPFGATGHGCIENYVKRSFMRRCEVKVQENKRRRSKVHIFIKAKIFNFQNPPFEERTDLGKVSLFLELIFLVNGIDSPPSNLT
jgi:hypothetical protein